MRAGIGWRCWVLSDLGRNCSPPEMGRKATGGLPVQRVLQAWGGSGD